MIVCVSIEDDYDTSPPFGAWSINDFEQMKYDLTKRLHELVENGYGYDRITFRLYSGCNLLNSNFITRINEIALSDIVKIIDNAIQELNIEHFKKVTRSD